jgi:hypothetical protein
MHLDLFPTDVPGLGHAWCHHLPIGTPSPIVTAELEYISELLQL